MKKVETILLYLNFHVLTRGVENGNQINIFITRVHKAF